MGRAGKVSDEGREPRLAASLKRAGLRTSPDDFVELVRASLASLAIRPVEPSGELTPEEAAHYRAGGFELGRLSDDEPDPLALSAADFTALLHSSLSVAQAAGRLGVSASRIRQLLSSRSLYGVKLRGEWRLPRFQFTRSGLVPGIERVLRRLPGDLHPVEVWNWFRVPDPDLELAGVPATPLAWLSSGGNPDTPAALAEDL